MTLYSAWKLSNGDFINSQIKKMKRDKKSDGYGETVEVFSVLIETIYNRKIKPCFGF